MDMTSAITIAEATQEPPLCPGCERQLDHVAVLMLTLFSVNWSGPVYRESGHTPSEIVQRLALGHEVPPPKGETRIWVAFCDRCGARLPDEFGDYFDNHVV